MKYFYFIFCQGYMIYRPAAYVVTFAWLCSYGQCAVPRLLQVSNRPISFRILHTLPYLGALEKYHVSSKLLHLEQLCRDGLRDGIAVIDGRSHAGHKSRVHRLQQLKLGLIFNEAHAELLKTRTE
jgi:hypothetical protein